MHITQLKAENVKRLTAVSITPDGNMVVIGGKNGSGKSSCLDSILYALGGKGAIPGKPVRDGELEADITVRLDGDPPLVVTRTIKADGSSKLEVIHDHGDGVTSALKSPQKVLDSLIGRIAFDPLAFTRQKPADQVETLKEITGVDTTEADTKIDSLFDQRSEVNREVKRLEGVVASLPVHEGVPDEEQSSADVLAELNEAREHNDRVDSHFVDADKADDVVESALGQVADTEGRISNLESQLEAARKELHERRAALVEFEKDAVSKRSAAEILDKIDLAPIESKLSTLESVNARVRDNAKAREAADELEVAKREAVKLSEEVESARKSKLALMAGAEWPVEGLGFGERGVTFNDLPFDQCSSAEQIRISTAIGLSQHPKLKVLFIRDGSLLDEDSLADVARMAEQYGGQVWVEAVRDDETCTVVIEDGMVASRKGRSQELQTA